jgi:NADH-quinone oxidoreductase subunit N
MILVIIRVYIYIIHSFESFNQILIFVAILSLIVGSLGALRQQNIKRMLAYSGIGHVGFIIAGLSSVSFESLKFESLKAVILYAVVYASLSIGSFALLILLVNKNKKKDDEDGGNDVTYRISSLAGISKSNPFISLCLAILMFSMAGIPPMAGFFAKFYILLSIIKQELYYLAVIAVMSSIISAFYYLRIIKIMYFDEKDTQVGVNANSSSSYILFFAAMFNLFLIAFIKPMLSIISNLFN